MAYVSPSNLIGNYALVESEEVVLNPGIYIPLSALPGLTGEEAATNTGDGNKVVHELVKHVFRGFNGLDAAGKPSKFTVAKGTPTGISPTTVRQTYTLSFDLDISGSDVASEPQVLA